MRRQAGLATLIAVAAIGGLVALRHAVTDDPLERLRAQPGQGGTTVHAGSWQFPRGGPYILGFHSPGGPATLSIDGVVVARGAGEQTSRRLHDAHVAAVELVAPPGARLLWHPPGRRGPPEYVPPSSLSPDPPATAAFPSWSGSSPGDGVFAAAIAAVVLALLAFLCRDAIARVDRPTLLAVGGVFALAAVVRLIDLGGAGQTWDEDVNWSAGRNYVTNLLSLDFSAHAWTWNFQHPPVMKYIAGIGAQLADGYGPARALSALVMAAACALLVPIGERLFSRRVGVLAGAIAALTPHLVAHGKVVGHEAPTALWWALAIWLCLRAFDGIDANDWRRLARRFAVIGIVLGLAVFSRFVNGLLAPLIGALLLVGAPPPLRRQTLVLGLAIIPVVALATGIAIWPRLWTQPIDHLIEAWQTLRQAHSPEPYLGGLTNHPPPSYFVVYLAATAPLAILVGAVAFAGRAIARRERASLIVLLWLIAPLGVMASPVRQDGVRYVIPALFALAVAAAAGFDWSIAALARRFAAGRESIAVAAAGCVLAAYLAISCARVHPYYLDYYGEHVGGPGGAARGLLFEVAWWGEGLEAAVDHVNREAAAGARVHRKCVEPSHLTWLRGDLWRSEVASPAAADWILDYQPLRRRCPIPADAEPVFEESVQGAPLVRVYRRPR